MGNFAQQLEQLEQDMYSLTRVKNACSAKKVGEWADRLSAIRAAVGGEAVAWMLRRKRDDFVRGCYATKPTAESLEFAELDGDYYTPLYASPTATVDAGALKGLMRDLMQRAKATRTYDTAETRAEARTLEGVIDKLAALIGKGA